jgi:hypothetical protein
MPHTKCSWVLLLSALSLAACGFESRGADDGWTDADPDDDTGGDTDTGPTPPGCDRIDLLIVVDSRGNTEELRELVSGAARDLSMALYEHLAGAVAPVDLRVGVTTTSIARSYSCEGSGHSDTGPDGTLLGTGSCDFDEHPWVQFRGDDPYQSAMQVKCVVHFLETSPAFLAMPLAAIHQALGTDPDAIPGLPARSAPGQPNEGFYRDEPGTLLAVVAVVGTDDCSVAEGGTVVGDPLAPASCSDQGSLGLYPPVAVAEFLGSVSDGGERLAFAALAPDPDPAADSVFCAPARRLGELADLLGPAAAFDDLCAGGILNVEEPFEAMAEWFVQRCDDLGSP